MSSQIINIGPAPCEENAAQLSRPDYEERSWRECHVFRHMLERLYPVPPGASLVIESSPYDFGSYREVCVRYDNTDPVATDYAYDLERNAPIIWDASARYELIWLAFLDTLNYAVRNGEFRLDELPASYRSGQPPAFPAGYTLEQILTPSPR